MFKKFNSPTLVQTTHCKKMFTTQSIIKVMLGFIKVLIVILFPIII
jgi:hypothetical protein